MKHTIKNIAPCKIEVLTEVDKETWKAAQEKGFKKASAEVTIKGFRKGKAPEAMLRAAVDNNKVMDEAINVAIQAAFGDMIEKEGVRPMVRPDVTPVKLTLDELTLKFTVVTFPVVTLGEYKGLTATKEAPSVTDEEVDAQIKRLLERGAELTVADKEAAMGDTVVLDFEGFVDGKAFEGGKAENHSLELGSHAFIPGFEESLVGVKAGDEKDVEVTFPTQYVAELAGKKAVFKCKIHEVKEKKIPELNDEAVKDMGIPGVETVEALKANQKEQILTSKVDAANRAYYDAIVSQIVKNAKVEIAEEVVVSEAARQEEETKRRIAEQGLTFEQYLEIIGKKPEDIHKEAMEGTRASLTTYLVLEEIGHAEKLTVSDEDVAAEIKKMADQYKMKEEEVKKILEPQMENFKSSLRSKKIQDFILANSK